MEGLNTTVKLERACPENCNHTDHCASVGGPPESTAVSTKYMVQTQKMRTERRAFFLLHATALECGAVTILLVVLMALTTGLSMLLRRTAARAGAGAGA